MSTGHSLLRGVEADSEDNALIGADQDDFRRHDEIDLIGNVAHVVDFRELQKYPFLGLPGRLSCGNART